MRTGWHESYSPFSLVFKLGSVVSVVPLTMTRFNFFSVRPHKTFLAPHTSLKAIPYNFSLSKFIWSRRKLSLTIIGRPMVAAC